MNAIRAADISIYNLTDEATNREDIASDKENSAAEKVAVVIKGEAANGEATRASKTDNRF